MRDVNGVQSVVSNVDNDVGGKRLGHIKLCSNDMLLEFFLRGSLYVENINFDKIYLNCGFH